MNASIRLVLIDGYNVIRRSDALARAERRSLQNGRDMLITQLAARYAHGPHQIVLVFDGAGSSETREARYGITVVFTPHHETADDCIVRMAGAAKESGRQVMVATDDNGIRTALGGMAPNVQTQTVADVRQQLNAPDRHLAKQYRHRQAVQRIIAEQNDPDADVSRDRRGNPKRPPKRRS